MGYLRLAAAIVFFLFGSNVLAGEVAYNELMKLNADNVNKIQIGMSEKQVRKTMGDYSSSVRDGSINNPWKTERMGNMIILHYLVRRHPPFTPLLENQASPIIIKGNKVVGIGRNYLKAARNTAATENRATNPSSSSKSVEERMKTLKKLYKSGEIDKATYEKQKKRILDSI